MIVIATTRYGGVYEGGRWAAFAVRGFESMPDEPFSDDTTAVTWWDYPTLPVGVGDSPNDALARLQWIMSRDRSQEQTPLFAIGERVTVATCAPSDYYEDNSPTGVVDAFQFRLIRPYAGGPRGEGIYSVSFADGLQTRVPERYLRTAAD